MLTAIRSIIDVSIWEQPAGTQPRGPMMPATWQRLELLLRGRAWCQDKNVERELTAGDLAWDGPEERTLHRCGPDGFTAFVVTVEVAAGTLRDGPRMVHWGGAAAARTFAAETVGVWRSGIPAKTDTGIWAFARLRFEALRRADERPGHPALARALQAISEHVHNDIGVEDLARAAGLSPSRLHAHFARYLGTTPHRSMLAERMARAKAMLTDGDDPLSLVARTCGFADAASLCRTFRREMGVTPGGYRALQRPATAQRGRHARTRG